ncbi:MAG TPA: alkaline phosphatase family protein [Polyangia bacterium]|nr:alkaline phosphatase family protein [Polyangia bacterium]
MLLAAACGPSGARAPGSDGGASQVSGRDPGGQVSDGGGARRGPHIFVIPMENESVGAIYGSDKAPYINGTLLAQYASASNFVDEIQGLPSEPHYVWMEAGTNAFADHTFETDSSPSASNSTASTDHLVTQIEAAGGGLDWTAYVEEVDLSAQPCPISGVGTYVPRHVPFLFFQDVVGSPPSKTTARCAAHQKPLSALAGDLAAGTVASYAFITPNLCHDMHGSSSCPSGDKVQTGDAWLMSTLPSLISYVDGVGGIIFIVWDEGTKLPFIAVGPQVKHGYSSPAALNHGSLLKTVEEMLGLPVLPTVQAVDDLGDLFASGAVPAP